MTSPDSHDAEKTHDPLTGTPVRRPGFHSFAPLRFVCLAAAFGLGAIAMGGWLFEKPQLRSFLASGSEMKPNTALALMLLSFAALAFGLKKPRLARILAHACS